MNKIERVKMQYDDYPALFKSADQSSNDYQKQYLWLIFIEYALLILSAFVALHLNLGSALIIIYTIIIIMSSGLLIFMSMKKPEKDWYGCRALAESVKTSSWRYMMRAEPFQGDDNKIINREFCSFLDDILTVNQHLKESISRRPESGSQITTGMTDIRGMDFDSRKEVYLKERISNQKDWYVAKSKFNRKKFSIWITVCILVQASAIILALLRIKYGLVWTYWPIEPLIVCASAIVGWIQIKKYNELSSAYSLTAHEIGIIESKISEVSDEEEFSQFVNEAELAFSREHTQWIARQHSY